MPRRVLALGCKDSCGAHATPLAKTARERVLCGKLQSLGLSPAEPCSKLPNQP
jgi:hypothetical protein